ncbi:protein-serine/threonine phosphatase SCDLUD_001052 [Saccharomycodes ludwigii]|uniref:protein-serine/threonine phosphatase n=1 Tax=Saccharomycodes ludwigii TaxID=36035 RepID=UPI001E8A56A6|nr:hypothetical protein SCDLUD_001052 [Saccharomycodes ludwigii]KAH3903415.1 hypothetical protein SCDLUD_001052 [Saccharomycodes ludwigii]
MGNSPSKNNVYPDSNTILMNNSSSSTNGSGAGSDDAANNGGEPSDPDDSRLSTIMKYNSTSNRDITYPLTAIKHNDNNNNNNDNNNNNNNNSNANTERGEYYYNNTNTCNNNIFELEMDVEMAKAFSSFNLNQDIDRNTSNNRTNRKNKLAKNSNRAYPIGTSKRLTSPLDEDGNNNNNNNNFGLSSVSSSDSSSVSSSTTLLSNSLRRSSESSASSSDSSSTSSGSPNNTTTNRFLPPILEEFSSASATTITENFNNKNNDNAHASEDNNPHAINNIIAPSVETSNKHVTKNTKNNFSIASLDNTNNPSIFKKGDFFRRSSLKPSITKSTPSSISNSGSSSGSSSVSNGVSSRMSPKIVSNLRSEKPIILWKNGSNNNPTDSLNIDDCIDKLLKIGETGNSRSRHFSFENWEIQAICLRAREIFLSEPSLLRLQAPIKVVGDVHGQFNDLLRILKLSGAPHQSGYLFLGDYVDRGKQSLETILLLLCFKIKYPNTFYMLRGNHESANVTKIYGFYDECKRRTRSSKTWKVFVDCFNSLPFAAIINNKIFCVHGGISPQLESLKQISKIQRPTDIPDDGLLTDLLWSDPDPKVNDWKLNDDRGVSYVFGKKNVYDFVSKFDFDLIIRGHMVVEDGYEFFARKKFVTVFSAPNYCGEFNNWGAVMSVTSGLICSFELLKPRFTKKK